MSDEVTTKHRPSGILIMGDVGDLCRAVELSRIGHDGAFRYKLLVKLSPHDSAPTRGTPRKNLREHARMWPISFSKTLR